MVLFRACIHLPKINGDPLTKEKIEALSGFVWMRTFGTNRHIQGIDEKYMLFKFEIDSFGDIEDIHNQLQDFEPTYCFRETCPWNTKICPAHRT